MVRHPVLLSALVVLTLLPGAVRAADDEEDRVVFNKKASEWMQILRTDKEPRRRRVALVALDAAGPKTRRVFAAVGTALREDSDEMIRTAAAQWLGLMAVRAQMEKDRIPIDEAIESLIFALKNDKAPGVREMAAGALSRIGLEARSAIPTLAAALKESHPGLRGAAAECMGRMEYLARLERESLIKGFLPELIKALRESKGKEYARARGYVIYAIGRLGGTDGKPAITTLVEVLNEPDLSADLRKSIAETLGLFGRESAEGAPALARLLQDPDIQVKRAAATALDQLEAEARPVIPALIKAMQDRDKYVKCSAIHALGQIGGQLGPNTALVIQGMRACLKDSLADVRMAAIQGLGMLGPGVLGSSLDAVKGELKVALQDGDMKVRETAEATLKALDKKP